MSEFKYGISRHVPFRDPEVCEKVRRIDRGDICTLHSIQQGATPAGGGNSDWKQVEVVFESGPNDSVQINCLLGGSRYRYASSSSNVTSPPSSISSNRSGQSSCASILRQRSAWLSCLSRGRNPSLRYVFAAGAR